MSVRKCDYDDNCNNGTYNELKATPGGPKAYFDSLNQGFAESQYLFSGYKITIIRKCYGIWI